MPWPGILGGLPARREHGETRYNGQVFDWSDLRIFLAVHRAGSLSAAARPLGIDASTAGRRLASLEQALGERLFDRVPEGLVPTAAGAEILDLALAMEEKALAVERALGSREGGIAGTVRLTTVEILASRFLAPRVPPLLAAHPGLRLELLTASRVLDLPRREADLALRMGKPTEPGLAGRKLGSIAFALYGSDREAPLFAFDESLAHLPESAWLEGFCRGREPILRSNSTAVLFEAVRAGAGNAVLPCWLGDDAGLQRLIEPEELPSRELWLVVHPDSRRIPRIRAVADFLAERIEREEALLLGRRQGSHSKPSPAKTQSRSGKAQRR